MIVDNMVKEAVNFLQRQEEGVLSIFHARGCGHGTAAWSRTQDSGAGAGADTGRAAGSKHLSQPDRN